MKKGLVLFVAVLLFFTGCSMTDTDKPKIGLSMATRDAFLTSMEAAAVREALSADVSLSVANANNDQDVQLAQVEDWARKGYAAVIVVLCEDSAAERVLQKAGKMSVVFLNRVPADLSVLAEGRDACYIGNREPDAGRMQGEYLAEQFTAAKIHMPHIAVLRGRKGSAASDERIGAAKQALEDAGISAQYVFEAQADWDRAAAQKSFAAFLKDHPRMDAVIAANDEMAIGAADALTQARYTMSEVRITGVDATEEGREALRNGKIDFTVYQDPQAQGAGAVAMAVQLMTGELPSDLENGVRWLDYTPVAAKTPEKR